MTGAPPTLCDASALAALVQRLAGAPAIALDTEGNSFHAYTERVCLIQIGLPGEEFLVDPLAVDPRPLAPILADPARRLLFHGGDFDVRSLRRDFGFSFGRVFDTMIAAQVLGLPELGLAGLLRTRLGVRIEKGEQRSDWGRRPLSAQQLRYAAADVRFLGKLADGLDAELTARGKQGEAARRFEGLRHVVAREKRFDAEGWRRLREAPSLGPDEAGLLRRIWVAREELARALDRPPFKVIGERVMVEIARRRPRDAEDLRRIPGVSELFVRRLGAAIVAQPPREDVG